MRLYRQVLAQEPRNAVTLINLGHALGAQRQFEAALAAYDQALALDPGHAPLHFLRGETLQWLLRYGEALQAYDHFLGSCAWSMRMPGSAAGWLCRVWGGWKKRWNPIPRPKRWTRHWRRPGSIARSAIC